MSRKKKKKKKKKRREKKKKKKKKKKEKHRVGSSGPDGRGDRAIAAVRKTARLLGRAERIAHHRPRLGRLTGRLRRLRRAALAVATAADVLIALTDRFGIDLTDLGDGVDVEARVSEVLDS